jgi:hypothetical protein
VVVVYQESHHSEERAIARERQIKRWTHAKKMALVAADRVKVNLSQNDAYSDCRHEKFYRRLAGSIWLTAQSTP